MSDYQAEYNAVRDTLQYLIGCGEFERMFKEAVAQAVKESVPKENTRADSPDAMPQELKDALAWATVKAKQECYPVPVHKHGAVLQRFLANGQSADSPEDGRLQRALEEIEKESKGAGVVSRELIRFLATQALAPFRQRRTDAKG